jgi:ribonuclease HI
VDRRTWVSSFSQGSWSGTGGFRTLSGAWAGVYGQSSGSRLGISLGKHATVFQAEIYAMLACTYGIQTNARSEKCVSCCSDSQGALEVPRTAKTTSPLMQLCQKAMNISTHYSVGLFWVPGHSGGRGNETAEQFAKDGTLRQFAGPQPALGVSRHNTRRKIQRWMDNQRMAMARKLISGPNPTAQTMLPSFNRVQSKVVNGHLAGRNTRTRNLHLMGLIDSSLCRRCGAEETSSHVLRECEASATLRQAYLGSFLLDPEDVRSLRLEANCNCINVTGFSLRCTEGLCNGLRASGPTGLEPTYNSVLFLFYSTLFYSILFCSITFKQGT